MASKDITNFGLGDPKLGVVAFDEIGSISPAWQTNVFSILIDGRWRLGFRVEGVVHI
jgi:transcriptional regulator of aromatic amino acid metabolism